MATYWENSCSFGLRYVSWYKYLIVSLVFSHLGFWSGNLFLIAPFPDLCLLVTSSDDLSTLSDSEDEQYPFLYVAFFCRLTTLYPIIFLACQILSVQLRLACVLEQSSL